MKCKSSCHRVVWGTLGVALSVWVSADAFIHDSAAQKLLSDLHHSNEIEIRIGTLAEEKGTSEVVRALGNRLIRDHRQGDEKVRQVAESEGIPLISPFGSGFLARVAESNENGLMSDLLKKTGRDFDQAFTKAAADDHTLTLEKLQRAKEASPASAVRDLAAELLPAIEQDLQAVEVVQQSS